MIKLDISNRHRKKFVAFAIALNKTKYIIASDTMIKLMKHLLDEVNIFEDFYIFDGRGRLVEAYRYSHKLSAETILNYGLVAPYEKIKF